MLTEEDMGGVFDAISRGEMTADKCREIINGPGDEHGPIDAYDLLELAFGKAIDTRFKRLNTTMKKLLDDVKEAFPEAEYYTSGGDGFALLLGPSHRTEGGGEVAQQELVALSGTASVGGGDW